MYPPSGKLIGEHKSDNLAGELEADESQLIVGGDDFIRPDGDLAAASQ